VGCLGCPGLHYSSEPAHGVFLRWVSTEDEAPELREALGGELGLHEALERHEFLAVVPEQHEFPDVVPERHVVPAVALGLHEVRRVAWARYAVPTPYAAWVRDETLAWAGYEVQPGARGEILFAAWAVFQSVAQDEIQGETLAAIQSGALCATGHSVQAATRSLAGLGDDSQVCCGFQAARSQQLYYRRAGCEPEQPVAWQQQQLQAARDWR
jgi:hypothetical protein